MIESITNLYTSMEQATQHAEVSTAVLAKSIDTVQQAGENLESLMHAAAPVTSSAVTDPLLGQHIDITA